MAALALTLVFCGDPSSNGAPPGDSAPQAAFTATCTERSCAFADGSTDPDGAIVRRMWSYGDESPPSPLPAHEYAADGSYTVTLTVSDDQGSDAAVSHDITVPVQSPPPPPPPPPNTTPTAVFTASCGGLGCTFADGSSDADGTIASRSWAFGDGATSSATSPSHTYAQAGTYTARLTVTDNGGANDTDQHSVTVSNPAISDIVFIGAGDIAGCSSDFKDRETAAIIQTYPTATVFALGDNAYDDGTSAQYNDCYGRSWGAFKGRTKPAPGNHEYHTAGAPGYFGYFGSIAGPSNRGYYSYDLGGWHIVSLNSEIDVTSTSAQATWLKQDLAAHPAACTIAYWHKPLFTSAVQHPNETKMRALYTVLYDGGAEIVMSGHNHMYERFAPQRPDGIRDDAKGIREFVVGSGGHWSLYDFTATPQPNSVARYSGGWGVLKLTLKASSYTWEFLPTPGSSFNDTGSGTCH